MTTPGANKPMAEAGKTRLLVIDDDKKLCRLIRDYLEPMGYEVESAHTGPDGLDKAQTGQHQVIILDVMLPGMDGFEVLKQLRRTSDVPVLMLTSRGEEPDRIVGLEIGADDYLPKTFSTCELLARLRAVTRRATRAAPGVPEASLQQIFDPFFRGEPSRSRDTGGVGLGLAIVKTCVEACRGTVSARNRVPRGLEVEIILKAAP